jgi:hypothetical protein
MTVGGHGGGIKGVRHIFEVCCRKCLEGLALYHVSRRDAETLGSRGCCHPHNF